MKFMDVLLKSVSFLGFIYIVLIGEHFYNIDVYWWVGYIYLDFFMLVLFWVMSSGHVNFFYYFSDWCGQSKMG